MEKTLTLTIPLTITLPSSDEKDDFCSKALNPDYVQNRCGNEVPRKQKIFETLIDGTKCTNGGTFFDQQCHEDNMSQINALLSKASKDPAIANDPAVAELKKCDFDKPGPGMPCGVKEYLASDFMKHCNAALASKMKDPAFVITVAGEERTADICHILKKQLYVDRGPFERNRSAHT